jgi:hypothetical protein
MRTKPNRGSHLPVLMKLFSLTSGPILELGSGMYSTPYLHWACFPTKRRLITYEDNPDWTEFVKQFETDFHSVNIVKNWNSVEFPESSIAFVDHDPKNGRMRHDDVARLTHCDYVVCHDAENSNDKKYGYSKIHGLFKYRWKYTAAGLPYTAVFSNKYELKGI